MEKVCGVICEYNPLHRGHAHHLERARALTGADFVVCAMSGPFVQRGEPAVLDKWTRAQAALLAGADLVLELPALFAVRAAPDFAFGGAALLAGLGVVTHLSFGAEDADLAHLTDLAAPESAEESARIRAYLEGGHSHPQARALARGRQLPPNVTLGVEYLRALRRLGSGMEPVPVPRETAHNDERLHALSSATAVRRALAAGAACSGVAAVSAVAGSDVGISMLSCLFWHPTREKQSAAAQKPASRRYRSLIFRFLLLYREWLKGQVQGNQINILYCTPFSLPL